MVMSKSEKERANARKSSARAWADRQDQQFEPTAIKLPEKVPFLKLRVGVMRLDIIPYIVGKGNKEADEGEQFFLRGYHSYFLKFPNGKSRSYIAPQETWNKPDPIANWVAKHGGAADKSLVDALRPKYRLLLNVVDVSDDKEKAKGVQIFQAKYGSIKYPEFGFMLKNKVQMLRKYENFDSLTDGYTLVLKVEEDSFSGTKFSRITSIEFDDREEQYDPSFIKKAVCLDDCLVKMKYEELEKVFLQSIGEKEVEEEENEEKEPEDTVEEENEHEPVVVKKKKVGEPEDSDDDEPEPVKKKSPTADQYGIKVGMKCNHEDFGLVTVTSISGDTTSISVTDDDDESFKVGPEELTILKKKKAVVEEEEIEDDEPVVTKKKKSVEPEDDEESLDDDEPDDDLDEDDEPEPVKKKVKK